MLFRKALQKISKLVRNGLIANTATGKMDINNSNFNSSLLSLLRAISKAHFVAIDLELSGIPSHQIHKPRIAGNRRTGKATLQERYEDTKEAAEKYQVLQVGITCVEEHKDRGKCRTENTECWRIFNLTQVSTLYRHSISF